MYRLIFPLFFLFSFSYAATPPIVTFASNGQIVVQSVPGSTISNQIAQMTSPVTTTGSNFGINNSASATINNIGSNATRATVAVKSTLNVAKTTVKDIAKRAVKNKRITPQAVVVDLALAVLIDKLVEKGLEWKQETSEWLMKPLGVDPSTVQGTFTQGWGYFPSGPYSSISAIIDACNAVIVSGSGVVGAKCIVPNLANDLELKKSSTSLSWIRPNGIISGLSVISGLLTAVNSQQSIPATDDFIDSAVDSSIDSLDPAYIMQVVDQFEPIDSSKLPMTAYIDPSISMTNAYTKWQRIIPASESSPSITETAVEKSIITASHTLSSPATGTGAKTVISYGVATEETISTQTMQQDGTLSSPATKTITTTTTTAQTKTTTDASGTAVADPTEEVEIPPVAPSVNFPNVPDFPKEFSLLPDFISDFITAIPWIPSTFSCTNPKFPYFANEFELPLCEWIEKFRGLFEWFWGVLTAISIYLLIRSSNNSHVTQVGL